MKKRIFSSIIVVALPCIVILAATLVYLFNNHESGNELVNNLAIIISVAIAVAVAALFVANYVAQKLTNSIVGSLENIGTKFDSITMYEELMQFAVGIKDQKQTLRARIEELSNRTDTMVAITESMQEGLILIDNEGLILSANKSAEQVFGTSIERRSLMHICRDDEFQKAVKHCIAGEYVEIQMERDIRIFTLFFSPVFSGKKARGAVILMHDATEKQRAENQRREFTANVSHELKTPLTTISALSEMISQGMAMESDIKTFAGRITEQSGRLLLLIDDIIRLSEFDEGRANREATIFDLWELAATVISTLRDNSGGIEIVLTGERFDISANSRMIDELLYNLIDNGVKYNNENGKVTVELARTEDGLCKISVSDTGIGIHEEHHPHVFERFYRAEKSRSKKTGGTGLGLSIVKHITEYYDGHLELKSTEGIGTTVTCYLRDKNA